MSPPKKTPKRKPKVSLENDENQPERKKKARGKKKSTGGGIDMSKQLAEKCKKRRTARSCSRKKNTEPRLCGNGKPMPSLAELEKMFEDSDTDEDQPTAPSDVHQKCKTPEPRESPLLINEEKLTSPSTLKRIVSKVMKRIEELPTIELDDDGPPPPVIPPKKRKKPDKPYIVGCKERKQVPWAPKTSFLVGDTKYGPELNSESDDSSCESSKKRCRSTKLNISKSIFNAHSDEIASRLIEIERINPAPEQPTGIPGPPSSNGSDTVDYEIKSPRPFSPLPSTSKDNNTIRMNDQLFNESLKSQKNNNNVSINETIQSEDSSKFTDCETSLNTNSICKTPEIEDENIEDLPALDVDLSAIASTSGVSKQNKVPDKPNDEIEIIETPTETIIIDDTFMYTPNRKSTLNITDDDECCIITSAQSDECVPKPEPKIHSFKDEIYGSIDLTSMETEPCEVIDVDDIIAESQAVINKIEKKRFNIDTVTLVEPSTSQNPETVSNISQNQSVEIIPSAPSEAVETSTSTLNESVQIIENAPSEPAPMNTNVQQNVQSQNDHNYSISLDLEQRILQPLFNRSRRNNNHRRNRNHPYNLLTNLFSYILPQNPPTESMRVEQRQPAPTQTQVNEPSTVSSPPNEARSRTRQIGDCPICMDSLSNGAIASTLCGHLFCMNCIKAAIQASGKRCPTCRKVLKGATPYHQIFI